MRGWAVLVAGALCGAVLAPMVLSAAPGTSAPSVYVARDTQCVLFDTRFGGGTVAGGAVETFNLVGDLTDQGGDAGCSVDSDAQGVHVNLVAIGAAGNGNLKAWPAGETEPNGGVVNYQSLAPNLNNANAVHLRVDSTKKLSIRANGNSVDICGILYGELVDGERFYTTPPQLAALEDRVFPGRYNIGTGELVPGGNYDSTDFIRGPGSILPFFEESPKFYTNVHLPDGATITRVAVIGVDNADGNQSTIDFSLSRKEITPTAIGDESASSQSIASGSSAGSDVSAVREIADDTIQNGLVDNQQYIYDFRVELTDGDLTTARVELIAAYVEYDMP